jgi:predicted nucleotidyltransferase
MAKAPQDPKEIFQEIISDYKGLYGDDLVSIILYGSATGQDYHPGKSDINFMIILTEAGIERLDRAFETVKKWRKRRVATPLFLTENYVETSLDVFPIEYLNFQRHHILVHGRGILADLPLKPQFIRLQCEREIKGKLLLLRHAFLESDGKGKAIKDVISQSLGAFAAISEALLYLKGLETPRGRRDKIRAMAGAFKLDSIIFEKLLDIREEKKKPGGDEMKRLFQTYLGEIRKLAKLVDELSVSDQGGNAPLPSEIRT